MVQIRTSSCSQFNFLIFGYGITKENLAMQSDHSMLQLYYINQQDSVNLVLLVRWLCYWDWNLLSLLHGKLQQVSELQTENRAERVQSSEIQHSTSLPATTKNRINALRTDWQGIRLKALICDDVSFPANVVDWSHIIESETLHTRRATRRVRYLMRSLTPRC